MAKTLIIDASVVAKWLLEDEQENPQALKIKNDFLDNKVTISVPIFLYYEVNNLLRSATLSKRMNPEKAVKAYQGFLDLGFIVYSSKELLTATLKKAFDMDISSYDASYIALAQYLQVPFYTADEKLVKKASTSLIKVLDDYPA